MRLPASPGNFPVSDIVLFWEPLAKPGESREDVDGDDFDIVPSAALEDEQLGLEERGPEPGASFLFIGRMGRSPAGILVLGCTYKCRTIEKSFSLLKDKQGRSRESDTLGARSTK